MRKRWIKRVGGAVLIVFGMIIVAICSLYRLDEKILWSIFPWCDSSANVQAVCVEIVQMGERLKQHPPEGENGEAAYSMGASMFLTVSVAMGLQTAQTGNIDEQVLSQYTMALARSNLMVVQGDFSEVQYQFYKLPYKTGSTWLMQQALPSLQRQTQLPEGFLSKESMEAQEHKKEEEAAQFLAYKEAHLYGRYYQEGKLNHYLEIEASEDKRSDVIRFVQRYGNSTAQLEQEFYYEQGKDSYRTRRGEGGYSEFTLPEEGELMLIRGGFESPSHFLRLRDDEFVIPDSSLRKLSQEEILALDEHTRWLAKNEIYARYNYPFQNEELRQYFEEKRWYRRAEYAAEEFREDSAFSEIERENVRLFTELGV